MRNAMIFSALISALNVTALSAHAFVPVTAFALQSGSQSGSQGGGAGFPNRPPRDPAVEAHNRGKALVSKKIGCKKCAHPSGVKDSTTARAVAAQVRAGDFDLKDNERPLVLFYLTNRFGI